MKKGCLAGLVLSLVFLVLLGQAVAEDRNLTVYAYRYHFSDNRWAVMLNFNHPVFPSNVTGATTVTAEKSGEQFDLLDPATNHAASAPSKRFIVVGKKSFTQPVSITIAIEKSLTDSSGRFLLEKPFSYQFLSVTTAYITNFSTFYRSKADKGVKFSTTETVSDDEISKAVEILPSVPGKRISRQGFQNYQITGDFEFGRNYKLKIAPVTISGGKAVLEAKEFSFTGPGIQPEISIKTDRSIVELRGRQLMSLTLSNVDKVRCELTRVPAFLLPEASQQDSGGKQAKKFDLESQIAELKKLSGVSPLFLAESSRDSEVFFAKEGKDHVYPFSVPFAFRKNPDDGGAWLATFKDADNNFKGAATRLVQITDLSITYKSSPKNLLLWVTTLYAGQPVPGAEVLLSTLDGAKFFPGKTDENGCLMIGEGQEVPSVDASGTMTKRPILLAKVAWAVAATPTDSCGLQLNGFELKPFTVTPEKTAKESVDSYTGYAFTERGVYKPGETVHFKFLARGYEQNKIISPVGKKVHIDITDPREEVSYSKDLALNDYGSCWDTFEVKSFFPVGTYNLKASVARSEDKTDTFSTTFMVQEFKRIRHYVTLSVKQQRVAGAFVGIKRDEDFLTADISGQYYTGGPVKHGKVRWKATLVPAVNKVKEWDAFFFGNESDTTQFLESGESMLDSQGKLSVSIPLDSRLLTGIYGVNISATVLDVDGEPATEVTTYNPLPNLLVGVSDHPTQVQTGYSAPLRLVVIDREGKSLKSGTLEVGILKQDYYYTEKRDDQGNVSESWEEGWVKTLSTQVSLTDGQAVFQPEFNEGGNYMLSFTYADNLGKYSTQIVFKVGWQEYDTWARENLKTGPRTGREVLLSLNKKEYKVGETLSAQFSVPRPVKQCLVTVEKSGILEYRVVNVNGTNGSFQLATTKEFQPNAYISVFAPAGRAGFPVYSSQVDSDIPMIYFGYTNVSVRSDAQSLRVEIQPSIADLKGRPGEKKTVDLLVTDQARKGVVSEMAVCVVDEAVLALTRFQTPSLSSLAQFTLPLGVFSGDLRMGLVSQDLYRLLSTKPLTGGGMGLGEVNSTLRKDFRPVAYFNPAVVTDATGKATVEFTLPDTTTSYRVYAVVCDKQAGFGSAQRNMVVTKEFFVEPSLPRFLVPGDKVTFPLVLHNKTADKGHAEVRSEASGDLELRVLQPGISLEPWSSAVIKASAHALGGTAAKGVMRFAGNFTADKAKFTDAIELTLPIHSRFLPVNRMQIGDFTNKTQVNVSFPDAIKHMNPDSINPADFKANIILSMTNWSKLTPGLKYLLHFPYGCIEQTSSGVIPLAALRGLIQSGTIPGIRIDEVDKFLKSGVDRLLSMQLPAGGFVYWPGQSEVSWWGTMYATFALMVAQDGGFAVPEDRLAKALNFLEDKLFDKNETDRYHGSAWTRELAVFNLSQGGKLTAQDLDRFMANYGSLSNEGKALLILSAKKIKLLPDAKLVQMVKQLEPKVDAHRSNYTDSSYREIALCLLAEVETKADRQKANTWAGLLIRGLKPDGRWFSTADTGWCLFALSKYYRTLHQEKQHKAKIVVDYGDKPMELTLTEASGSLELDPKALVKSGKLSIQSDSKSLIGYTLNFQYPDVVTDPAHLSNGFILTKRIENLNGKDEIRVGDVIRVTLEMDLRNPKKQDYGKLEYLALEDPVPAGIVPINSDLKTEGVDSSQSKPEGYGPDWMDNFTPSYFEFRDDGVRVFKDTAWTGRYKYSYLARATAEGEFWMRGSRISLMYHPERFGKTLGKKVTILPVQ
jgi:uncharacterized protein YfaS (alpha-2-macroglobulin family)